MSEEDASGWEPAEPTELTKPPYGDIAIHWEQVIEMAKIHCTAEEIAAVVGCCRSHLQRACKHDQEMPLGAFIKMHRLAGNYSLRRAQWKKATEQLDTAMLKFLGKNCLDQSEKPDTDEDGFVDSGVFEVAIKKKVQAPDESDAEDE